MNILFILLLIGAVFLLQSILGFLQVRNFVKEFRRMCKHGKVLIGKNPKKFRAGSILLLSIDENANIKEAMLMKGVTIFARFRELKAIEGKSLPILAASYDDLQRMDTLTKECLLNAYRNYINFKTGKMSRSDLDTSTNFFSLPVFEMWKNELVAKFRLVKSRVTK